jgi:hypothetical protein
MGLLLMVTQQLYFFLNYVPTQMYMASLPFSKNYVILKYGNNVSKLSKRNSDKFQFFFLRNYLKCYFNICEIYGE